jgi:hypothetical protein
MKLYLVNLQKRRGDQTGSTGFQKEIMLSLASLFNYRSKKKFTKLHPMKKTTLAGYFRWYSCSHPDPI